MATGRKNQLTKQIGEYLVACELARKGFLSATFSGNVPEYDIIATNEYGISCAIQVKASNTGTWQFDIEHFANITIYENIQVVGDAKLCKVDNLICIFVICGASYGNDEFYIISWEKLQNLIIDDYKKYLEKHHGIRPRKSDSKHCAISRNHLETFKDNWGIIKVILSKK